MTDTDTFLKQVRSAKARDVLELSQYAARLEAEAATVREVIALLSNGKHTMPAASKRRAKQGSRREQILAIVRASPGVTVAELGQKLGVDPTSLYRPVYDLKDDGLITKQSRQLRPV
jgi:DNA-binding transcriptional ArsR family regulator